MAEKSTDPRSRIDAHKMAITKAIYKSLIDDHPEDPLFVVAALAELTTLYGVRLMGRDEMLAVLKDMSKQVSEKELVWPF